MHLGHYLSLLRRAETDLAGGLRTVADAHRDEADVHELAQRLAEQCDRHAELLDAAARPYPVQDPPDQLYGDRFEGPRTGPLGLLRDLHDLYVIAAECDICWTLVGQAAQAVRDEHLVSVVGRCDSETAGQLAWLRSRLKQAAPQALVVAA